MAGQLSDVKAIPKRILISDSPNFSSSYASTPGGTLYSTTPGGTKIVYEKTILMNLRNSPLSKTPPKWEVPQSISLKRSSSSFQHNEKKHIPRNEHEQFELEM